MKQVEKLLKLDANLKITKIERENGDNIIYIESKKIKFDVLFAMNLLKVLMIDLNQLKLKIYKYTKNQQYYISIRSVIVYRA